MIFRARSVVTMARRPIDNGAVVVEGERVVDVGEFAEIRARHSGDIVDLGARAVLPGLINAHCHLDYTCLRGKIPRQKSFTDWIREINAEKAKLSPDDCVRSMEEGFAEAERFGTTTILNLTGFPELIARVVEPIRYVWAPELIDVRQPVDVNAILECANTPVLSKRSRRGGIAAVQTCGLAPHALYTASTELFRECERRAELLTTHLAESRDEMEMFQNARGDLYEFIKGLGRDMSDCGGTTPVQEFLGRVGDASLPRWIVAHLNELTPDDLRSLAKSTPKVHVVHCPRSHEYFSHSPFQFDRLRELGFNVCLGTDSLASNEDLSLFAEMRAFASKFPQISPEQILQMATVNPACALRMNAGRIAAGAAADLIAVPFTGGDIFDEIVAFQGQVDWPPVRAQM